MRVPDPLKKSEDIQCIQLTNISDNALTRVVVDNLHMFLCIADTHYSVTLHSTNNG